ncbi:hypothetical protein ACLB2K_035571 [Fragaria x ananassa]
MGFVLYVVLIPLGVADFVYIPVMALRSVTRKLGSKLLPRLSPASSLLHSHATSFGFKEVREEEKSQMVGNVFSNVASNYDTMNDLMSAGLHRLWKDRLVSKLNPFPGMSHLDVAGGTVDSSSVSDHFPSPTSPPNSSFPVRSPKTSNKVDLAENWNSAASPGRESDRGRCWSLLGWRRPVVGAGGWRTELRAHCVLHIVSVYIYIQQGCEADVRTRLKVWTSVRSPPSGAGAGAPPPQKTPAVSSTTFPPRRVLFFQFSGEITQNFKQSRSRRKNGKKWTRRGGKVVGDAAGVFWGGGAPSPAPDGGERTDVLTLSPMQTSASHPACDVAFRILDSINNIKRRALLSVLEDDLEEETKVYVCDINPNMLNVGKKRALQRGLGEDKSLLWVEGDAEALSFRDNTMDGYTIAFGIRNVTHIEKALSEAYRVLKRGGRFLCLELSHVDVPVFKDFYDFYSFSVIPTLGELVAGDRDSYQYLVESIRRFPPQETFASMIADAGFQKVEYENLVGGVVAIHSGLKI